MGKLKIVPYTLVLFILLFLVPFNIYLDNLFLAKLSGIFCLITLLISLKFWFYGLRKNSKKSAIVRLNTNDIFILNKSFYFINTWSDSEKKILYNRIGSVLAEVELSKDDNAMERNEAIIFSFFIGLYYYDFDFLPVSGHTIAISRLKFEEIKNEIMKSDVEFKSVESIHKLLKNSNVIAGYFLSIIN